MMKSHCDNNNETKQKKKQKKKKKTKKKKHVQLLGREPTSFGKPNLSDHFTLARSRRINSVKCTE